VCWVSLVTAARTHLAADLCVEFLPACNGCREKLFTEAVGEPFLEKEESPGVALSSAPQASAIL
jgi:hypothetical protein